MTNDEWQELLKGVSDIMYNPKETPARRRKAQSVWFTLTQGSVGISSSHIASAEGAQRSTRNSARITEAEYYGWMSNRD